MVSDKWCNEINLLISKFLFFLVFNLICISADFDPVHKGHEKIISEARKIAEKKTKKFY